MMFSLGKDFLCNSNLFYYSREVQFDCPEELEDTYFFTGRKKSLPLTEEPAEVLRGQRQTTVVCDKISKYSISTIITDLCWSLGTTVMNMSNLSSRMWIISTRAADNRMSYKCIIDIIWGQINGIN